MTHTYPLGKTALKALANAKLAARTRYEAEEIAEDGLTILALETDWITPSEKRLPDLMQQAEDNPAKGFVQHYEDASGKTVLAITYWKTAKPKAAKTKPVKSPPADAQAKPDHTDDLYFRQGRTRTGRRTKPAHPDQMDLFESGPRPKP